MQHTLKIAVHIIEVEITSRTKIKLFRTIVEKISKTLLRCTLN